MTLAFAMVFFGFQQGLPFGGIWDGGNVLIHCLRA